MRRKTLHENTDGHQNFQIEDLIPNSGPVEPDFWTMSQKFYCAT